MRVRVQVDEYREFGLVTRGEHAQGGALEDLSPLETDRSLSSSQAAHYLLYK